MFLFRRSLLDLQFQSRRPVRPRLSDQKAWAKRFAPETAFDSSLGTWPLLQRFTVPLIRQLASHAHIEGMKCLGLDQNSPPSFDTFKEKVFLVTGWRIETSTEELRSSEYFQLISEKRFPCIQRVRPTNEALCGSSPDFWHEAIGHIAPLIDPAVSKFYQAVGEIFLRSSRQKELENLLWVLLEYGFIRENGVTKTFGAAVTGSFVSLTKWRLGEWVVRPFDVDAVLKSGLFEHGTQPERTPDGKIIFYEMRSLEETLKCLF